MSGALTGTDMRKDDAAYEKPEVVSSVADHLAAFREKAHIETPTPAPAPQETEEQPTPEVHEDVTPAAEPAPEPEVKPEAGSKEAPTIPENIYRAAIHSGWKPEEIAEFHKANPEQAMKVFEKLHKSVNDLSRQFAEIGRTRIAAERQAEQVQQTRQQQTAKPPSFVDVEALRKKDPENALLPVVETLNQALQDFAVQQGRTPRAQTTQARTQEDIALATQVMTFLGADQLKVYNDFYGPAYDEHRMPTYDGHGLSPGQQANRDALLEYADSIWVGAKMHGRELAVPEALGLAHSLLTENIRTQKVRQELVGQVKQRSKGMTLRPTASNPVPADTGTKPKTPDQLEHITEARLAKFRQRM